MCEGFGGHIDISSEAEKGRNVETEKIEFCRCDERPEVVFPRRGNLQPHLLHWEGIAGDAGHNGAKVSGRLAKGLGVAHPGGIATDDLTAVAVPGSQLLVYGAAWFLVRRRLGRDARAQEGDRQAGLRRLYTNLVSLVSLGAWAIGAAGLLWTIAEQVEAPIIGVTTGDWKDPVSLWVTLLVVGAAVWLAHWRPAPWAENRQALSRRLYVWAALLASVLVILAGGIGTLYAVLKQVFSGNPKLADASNLDFGHYLAVIVVAAAVGAYHWRVLRADAAARPPKLAVAPAVIAEAAPQPVAPINPTASANSHSRRFVLAITDATEDDVHQSLANLPPHASYKLTPAEQGDLERG